MAHFLHGEDVFLRCSEQWWAAAVSQNVSIAPEGSQSLKNTFNIHLHKYGACYVAACRTVHSAMEIITVIKPRALCTFDSLSRAITTVAIIGK